jgi:hypothetical protein
MEHIPDRLPIRPILLAAIVGSAAVLIPARAEATCGSYVTILGSTPNVSHELPPAQPVCHGPSCSKLPAVPATPVSTLPISVGEMKQPFATIGYGHADGMRSQWPQPDSANLLPARLPSSIFHPPRDN